MNWTDGPMIDRKLEALNSKTRPFWRRLLPSNVRRLSGLLECRAEVEDKKREMMEEFRRQAAELGARWLELERTINASNIFG